MDSAFIDSVTLSFISHSYETVASILGPSNHALAEGDHQSTAVPSVDRAVTPSDEFFPIFTNSTAPVEAKYEGAHTKHNTEYLRTAEPHMWDLIDDQPASPSPSTSNTDGFLFCARTQKEPPSTEADVTEISKEHCEQVEEKKSSSLDHRQEDPKERLFPGKDTVHTSGCTESLLGNQQAEAEQDEGRVVLSYHQLGEG